MRLPVAGYGARGIKRAYKKKSNVSNMAGTPMLNFDFWDAEWPLIVAAPHIVLSGLAAVILILVVFLIVQLACSRQIAGLKVESVALNRRLRLASDRQDEVTRQLETVTAEVVELSRHVTGKATISVLLDDTAKLSGTIVDLAHANTNLATTLTAFRRRRAAS